MYKFFIDELHADYDIYIDPISSSAGRYASRRPHIFALIKELSAAVTLRGPRIVVEKNMSREIGTTDVVTTTDSDIVYYAQLLKSDVYSRFVKNRDPQASKLLTVVFERDQDGNYEVSDTWIGAKRPPLPGDGRETPESKAFWETHAYVHESQAIRQKTITKTCPY